MGRRGDVVGENKERRGRQRKRKKVEEREEEQRQNGILQGSAKGQAQHQTSSYHMFTFKTHQTTAQGID